MIYQYMDSKACEYAKFDPSRAKRLFCLLKEQIVLQTINIHIIGTNGKGSTGRFITQSIAESGLKVLHFTSPHIVEFRERFYKDGQIICLDELQSAHSFLQQFDFIHEASYFEYATFLALVLARDCDYLVMEAGVGGEHDSTSVLRYDISIFTRIGIDHKEMLGDTLEAIALTKLRAAQGNIFTHFQETEVLKLIKKLELIVPYAEQIKNIFYLTQDNVMQDEVKKYAKNYNIPLFLQENLALASLVLHSLQIPMLQRKLDLRGRCEIIQKNIMLDVGHNEMAAKCVLVEAKRHFNNQPFTLIYNSYRDKEIEKILGIFRNHVAEVILFIFENERILEAQEMEKIFQKLCIPYSFFCPDKRKLDGLSKNLIKSGDCSVSLDMDRNYLVFGSFSLVENFLLMKDFLQ